MPFHSLWTLAPPAGNRLGKVERCEDRGSDQQPNPENLQNLQDLSDVQAELQMRELEPPWDTVRAETDVGRAELKKPPSSDSSESSLASGDALQIRLRSSRCATKQHPDNE
jgi:hypothetical protein